MCSKNELEGAALPVVQDFEFKKTFSGQEDSDCDENCDPMPLPEAAVIVGHHDSSQAVPAFQLEVVSLAMPLRVNLTRSTADTATGSAAGAGSHGTDAGSDGATVTASVTGDSDGLTSGTNAAPAAGQAGLEVGV